MTRTITGRERDWLLQLEEDHFHNLNAREIKPSKLSESISAFCNSTGGEIYVGIRENKSGTMKQRVWDGFSDAEETNSILQMLDQIAPLAEFITVILLECPGERGLVLKLEVLRNAPIKKGMDGIPYIRKGARNLPVDTEEALERLQLDKGVKSYQDWIGF